MFDEVEFNFLKFISQYVFLVITFNILNNRVRVDLTRLLKSFKGAKRFWRHGPSGPGLSPIQRLVKSQGCIDFKIFVIIFIIKPFEPIHFYKIEEANIKNEIQKDAHIYLGRKRDWQLEEESLIHLSCWKFT